MSDIVDSDLPVEHQDVFRVVQVTANTALESDVAADLVTVGPNETSKIHRHNHAETVLYITGGQGYVVVDDERYAVKSGDRLRIGKAVYHGVATDGESLSFLSVQTPPILDKATGRFDLEPLEAPTSG